MGADRATVKRCVELQDAGRHEEALALLFPLIEQDPDEPRWWWCKARSLAATNRVTAMLDAVRNALEDDKIAVEAEEADWLDPYRDLPHVVLAAGVDPTLNQAMELLTDNDAEAALEALSMDGPYEGAARFLRGIALSELGRHDEAADEAGKVIELLPLCADAWFNRGCAYEVTDRAEDAIAAYTKGAEVAPDHANCLFNLGLLLRRLARLPESEAAFARATTADPHSPLLAYKRSEALALVGRLQEAETELARALKMDPAVRDAARESSIFPALLGEGFLDRIAKT
ncbi:MAG: tetratricopeptide repeat protein [Myxococcales bacterium]|nr:tetratricopeptide repeat protein [Myxococcales bacterium]